MGGLVSDCCVVLVGECDREDVCLSLDLARALESLLNVELVQEQKSFRVDRLAPDALAGRDRCCSGCAVKGHCFSVVQCEQVSRCETWLLNAGGGVEEEAAGCDPRSGRSPIRRLDARNGAVGTRPRRRAMLSAASTLRTCLEVSLC